MLDQRVLEANADWPSPAPSQDPAVRDAGDCRLANLAKLYHVPVSALRELLDSRAPGEEYDQLGQDELVAMADRLPVISAKDIEALYEDYRYGQRLSFYLHLLPDGLEMPTLEELQAALDDLAVLDQSDVSGQPPKDEAFETDWFANRIVLQDEDSFEEAREIRFRWFVVHRFLNVEEEPDQVLQVRRGFFWLDLSLGYLVIVSNDERVNALLVRALTRCLQAVPVPVQFPKELVDKHLSIEKVKSVSHYDPGTGIRQSISGRGLWKVSEQEILAREQRYLRPNSLYEEEVAAGVISGLGVTASKGKIFLTRALPTSLVRAWAMQRLPELVSDLKDWRASQPGSFALSIEAINRIRLPKTGKAAIVTIMEALLRADRERLISVPMPQTALSIYEALNGKYVNPYVSAQCSQCEEAAELCPHCESHDLDLRLQRITCKACGESISDGEAVTLGCLNGHITRAPLEEAWSVAPNHWLQKRLTQVFEEIGQSWDLRTDYFHVEGSTLYRLRRGQSLDNQLPQVVQTYINNFWEPVNSQVHAGTGDIIVEQTPSEWGTYDVPRGQRPGDTQHTDRRKIHSSLDLWLRGDAAAGYTVEAHASDGGTTSPEPLLLPAGRALQHQLERVLRRATTASEMRNLGKALFEALFPPPILKLWSRTVGSLGDQMGLRLSLHIGPVELTVLPWELVFDEEYLGLRRRYPIVRFLDLPAPPRPLAVHPPLRVLVVISQPKDLPPFSVPTELTNIQGALGELPMQIEVDVVEAAHRDALLAVLRQDYHVLHFVGHGKFDGEEGHLVFEDDQGRSDPVPALLLGQMVSDSDLRLGVLTACETSMTGGDRNFGGVAHQLVRGGVPAVVAMQASIPDSSAIAFSRGFYGALAHGWSVDASVQEGRRAIMTALGSNWNALADWAVPTLHMRAPDGAILEFRDR